MEDEGDRDSASMAFFPLSLGPLEKHPVPVDPTRPIQTSMAELSTITDMSAISIKEDVKYGFLEDASELQLRHRIDYVETIRHPLMHRNVHPTLLRGVCTAFFSLSTMLLVALYESIEKRDTVGKEMEIYVLEPDLGS